MNRWVVCCVAVTSSSHLVYSSSGCSRSKHAVLYHGIHVLLCFLYVVPKTRPSKCEWFYATAATRQLFKKFEFFSIQFNLRIIPNSSANKHSAVSYHLLVSPLDVAG